MRYQAVNNHICQLKNLEIHTVLSKEWQFQTNTEEEYYTNFDFPKIPWFSLPDIWCWFPICWLEIVTTDMVAIHQLRIPAAWSGAARNNYLLSAQQQPGWSGPSAATLYIIELQSQSVSRGAAGRLKGETQSWYHSGYPAGSVWINQSISPVLDMFIAILKVC